MNDRIHAFLDGDLPAEALTPAELAQAQTLLATLDDGVAALRRVAVPDLTERVMAALPVPEASPAREPLGRRLLAWLWGRHTLTLAYRPAYLVAGLATAALAAVLLPTRGPAPAAPPMAAERAEGAPRLYVQFRLEAPAASDVRLAGSFTGWEPELPLREVAPGVWTALVPLEPGVHDYTFLVDGERWVVDPYAPNVDDSFGGSNSRLFLPAPGIA